MGVNKHIIVATIIIGSSGIIKAWQSKQAITPVVIGAYVFMFALSLADMFGGPVSRVTSAIAMVAAITVILNDWTPIFALAQKAVGGK